MEAIDFKSLDEECLEVFENWRKIRPSLLLPIASFKCFRQERHVVFSFLFKTVSCEEVNDSTAVCFCLKRCRVV